MAFINNDGIININRGECFQVPLFINIGTDEEPIRLDFKEFQNLNIEIYLGIYPSEHSFECSFIRKKFTYLDANENGDIIIKLDPQDTINVMPGKYLYSIKARMKDDKDGEWVSTIIEQQEFHIL